jgi:RHS repeat-associated protein
VVGNYEYGPFGEVIRATGPMAKVNPLRFSTEYQDDESDIIMYPYRPYKASTGTWLCKDPLGEPGFELVANRPEVKKKTDQAERLEQLAEIIQKISPELVGEFRNQIAQANLNSAPKADQNTVNLYAFVQNDPVGQIDPFGLDGEATFGMDPTLLMDEEELAAYRAQCAKCALLRAAVVAAKAGVGALGGVKSGDSCAVLKAKTAAWLALAVARTKENQICFGGGNPTHQEEAAKAWKQVGEGISLQTEKGCVGSPTGGGGER